MKGSVPVNFPVWLAVIFMLLKMTPGQTQRLPEYVVSECYGDNFSFDCGAGNKIRINRDFFGVAPDTKTCHYGSGDCIISNPKSNSLIHRFCTGRRGCTYYQVERRGCNGYFSNYQQVEYQCVPEASITNICSDSQYQASSTYIASPNFPDNYPPNLSCSCTVTATSPGTRVRLEIVYLAIKYSSPCEDWLRIGRKRTCGTSSDLFSGRRIPIEFRSDGGESHSGFWLHFQASKPDGNLLVRCGNSSRFATLRRPATRPSSQRTQSRMESGPGPHSRGEPYTRSTTESIFSTPRIVNRQRAVRNSTSQGNKDLRLSVTETSNRRPDYGQHKKEHTRTQSSREHLPSRSQDGTKNPSRQNVRSRYGSRRGHADNARPPADRGRPREERTNLPTLVTKETTTPVNDHKLWQAFYNLPSSAGESEQHPPHYESGNEAGQEKSSLPEQLTDTSATPSTVVRNNHGSIDTIKEKSGIVSPQPTVLDFTVTYPGYTKEGIANQKQEHIKSSTSAQDHTNHRGHYEDEQHWNHRANKTFMEHSRDLQTYPGLMKTQTDQYDSGNPNEPEDYLQGNRHSPNIPNTQRKEVQRYPADFHKDVESFSSPRETKDRMNNDDHVKQTEPYINPSVNQQIPSLFGDNDRELPQRPRGYGGGSLNTDKENPINREHNDNTGNDQRVLDSSASRHTYPDRQGVSRNTDKPSTMPNFEHSEMYVKDVEHSVTDPLYPVVSQNEGYRKHLGDFDQEEGQDIIPVVRKGPIEEASHKPSGQSKETIHKTRTIADHYDEVHPRPRVIDGHYEETSYKPSVVNDHYDEADQGLGQSNRQPFENNHMLTVGGRQNLEKIHMPTVVNKQNIGKNERPRITTDQYEGVSNQDPHMHIQDGDHVTSADSQGVTIPLSTNFNDYSQEMKDADSRSKINQDVFRSSNDYSNENYDDLFDKFPQEVDTDFPSEEEYASTVEPDPTDRGNQGFDEAHDIWPDNIGGPQDQSDNSPDGDEEILTGRDIPHTKIFGDLHTSTEGNTAWNENSRESYGEIEEGFSTHSDNDPSQMVETEDFDYDYNLNSKQELLSGVNQNEQDPLRLDIARQENDIKDVAETSANGQDIDNQLLSISSVLQQREPGSQLSNDMLESLLELLLKRKPTDTNDPTGPVDQIKPETDPREQNEQGINQDDNFDVQGRPADDAKVSPTSQPGDTSGQPILSEDIFNATTIALTTIDDTFLSSTNATEYRGKNDLLTLGIVILCVCIGVGLLCVIITTTALYIRRKKRERIMRHRAAKNLTLITKVGANDPPLRPTNVNTFQSSSSAGANSDQDSSQGLLLMPTNRSRRIVLPTSCTSHAGSSGLEDTYQKGKGHQSFIEVDTPYSKMKRLDKSLQVDFDYEDYNYEDMQLATDHVVTGAKTTMWDSDSSMYFTPKTGVCYNHKAVQVRPSMIDAKHGAPEPQDCSKKHKANIKRRKAVRKPQQQPSSGSDVRPRLRSRDLTPDDNHDRNHKEYKPKRPPKPRVPPKPKFPGVFSDNEMDVLSCSDRETTNEKKVSMASMPGLSEMIFMPESEHILNNHMSDSTNSLDSEWETRSAISL